MDQSSLSAFQKTVCDYFVLHGRHDLPWRLPEPDGTFDPYKIMVSEIMLQQTQVARVRPKYEQFLRAFPTVKTLAAASLGEVLMAWQGLGYNRRAKYLWQAAQKIMQDFDGTFPATTHGLAQLPGVGANTAGAIVAYAYNRPAVFVETNIRTVFIHHFFKDQSGVPDKAVLEMVEKTLPKKDGEKAAADNGFTPSPRAIRNAASPKPVSQSNAAGALRYREWYWALMDYGVFLKQTVGNVSRASSGYAKQSKFEGSLRQVRGQVLRLLSREPRSQAELRGEISDARLPEVLRTLQQEGLIRRRSGRFSLF